MPTHEWKESTEDGERRIVRASRHAGTWSLQSKLKGEEFWTRHDPIGLEDLRSLRDVLWRKYQRGRIAHKDILLLDEMIETCEKESSQATDSGE